MQSAAPSTRGSLARRLVIVAGVVALALGGGAFAYYWFLVRGPLAGETSHDFGEVLVTAAQTDVSHTFHLVNRTSRTLRIERAIPECGCVVVTPQSATIEPGASVDLKATMLVSWSGPKTTPIRVMLDTGRIQFLKVSATGRRMANALPGPDDPTLLPAQPQAAPPIAPAGH